MKSKILKYATEKRALKRERRELYALRRSLLKKMAALDSLLAQAQAINSEQTARIEVELRKVVSHQDRIQTIADARHGLLQ